MKVRRLTGRDAAGWQTLRLDSLARFPDAFLTTHAEAVAVPPKVIAARLDDGLTFGIDDDDALIGIGSLIRMPGAQCRHRAELGAFYVRPAVQGSGAASALMEGMVAAALERGIWQLELFVAASNARAIAFYRRHGFAEVGRIPNATVADGMTETDIIMLRNAPPERRG